MLAAPVNAVTAAAAAAASSLMKPYTGMLHGPGLYQIDFQNNIPFLSDLHHMAGGFDLASNYNSHLVRILFFTV